MHDIELTLTMHKHLFFQEFGILLTSTWDTISKCDAQERMLRFLFHNKDTALLYGNNMLFTSANLFYNKL